MNTSYKLHRLELHVYTGMGRHSGANRVAHRLHSRPILHSAVALCRVYLCPHATC